MPFPILDIAPLPLRTDRTLRAVPYVTYTLCFLNIGIYLTTLHMSDYQQSLLIDRWGFSLDHPGLVTLFSHAFIHTTLLHLFGNMLVLWLVGTVLEAGVGSLLFALLYLASLVTATVLYGVMGRLFSPGMLHPTLIGASGAIAGVTGFAAFRYYHLRTLTCVMIGTTWLPVAVPIPYPIWLPLWSYAVMFGTREILLGIWEIAQHGTGVVAHWAHIGGLGLGMLTALLLKVAREGRREAILERSVRVNGGARRRTRREVERLLLEQPEDLDAMEALGRMLLDDERDRERGRDLLLKAIPRLLAARETGRAVEDFRLVRDVFPACKLATGTLMLVASALEDRGQFPDAAGLFTEIAAQSPDCDEAPAALLRAARIHQRHLHDPETAARLLNTLLDRYPTSPWRHLAEERLQGLGVAAE